MRVAMRLAVVLSRNRTLSKTGPEHPPGKSLAVRLCLFLPAGNMQSNGKEHVPMPNTKLILTTMCNKRLEQTSMFIIGR